MRSFVELNTHHDTGWLQSGPILPRTNSSSYSNIFPNWFWFDSDVDSDIDSGARTRIAISLCLGCLPSFNFRLIYRPTFNLISSCPVEIDESNIVYFVSNSKSCLTRKKDQLCLANEIKENRTHPKSREERRKKSLQDGSVLAFLNFCGVAL
jgi:hypothetical protein